MQAESDGAIRGFQRKRYSRRVWDSNNPYGRGALKEFSGRMPVRGLGRRPDVEVKAIFAHCRRTSKVPKKSKMSHNHKIVQSGQPYVSWHNRSGTVVYSK